MNGQILNNIYDVLSNDPNVQLESKDFESWKSSFLQNEEIVGNVYNYLINKKLTNSSPEQWVKNINEELAAQQPKQVKQKIEQPNPEDVARKEIMSQLPFEQKVGKTILDIFASLGEKEEREQLKTNVKNWWSNNKPKVISRLKKTQQSGTRVAQEVYDDKAIDLLMSSEDDVRFKGKGKKWFSTDEAKVQFVDPETGERVSEKSNPDNYRRLSNLNALGVVEIDRFYGDTDIKVGQFTDDYIVNKQKEIDKQEKLIMESGGFVKGVKGGSAADVVGGTLNFISDAFTSYIPAYVSRGLTLYPDIVAPFISDFNNEKAKTLYGQDNPDALKQLYDNDEDELITPMAVGLLARKLEDIGFKGIKKYIRSNPKKGNAIMGYITTGSKEGVTELGQEGLNEFNNSIAKGDDVITASNKMIDAMASEKGLEAFLGGFIGSVSLSASGKAVNRALISDNASVKEINSMINYISDLTYAKNETRDKDVKNAIDFEIQQAEKELKDYINEKRKVSEVFNEDQKSSLVDIMNQKDDIRTKIEKLQQQLNNEEISNKEFGYAFRSLNNQDKRLTEQIELINATAKEQLLQTSLETTQEEAGKLGLEQIELSQEEFAKQFPDDADSDGAIVGDKIYINRDVARETGAIGVGSHELLHGIIGNSYNKLKTEDKIKLNKEFLNLLGSKEKAAILYRLAKFYGITGDKVFETEELFTAFSDEIIDGGLSFNEGVFGKIKNTVHKVLNKLGYRKEFENARQTYNFLKDYSKNIKQGKLTERAAEFAKEDPGVEDTRMSKTASDNVQRIYEDQGVGGALDIIEQFKPITNKLVERRREAPGFDKQLLTDEIETGKRGILDLIQEYDPKSGVPLAAYINKFLPSRAIEASRRVLGEEFTEDVAEKVDVAAEEVVTEVKAKPKPRKIILSDRLGVKNKVNKAIANILPSLNIEKLNFKKLKNLVPEITGEMFGISPKKLVSLANITKKELQSAQMFINKNADVLISMLPEGATTGGTATGVPKTLLSAFYTKSDRAKMAKTGTKAGLAVQVKNPNITKKQFLEVFGIIDGKPDRTDRNTSARVLALANLTGKMMTNQAVRQELVNQGQPIQALANIADGKAKVMFSKTQQSIGAIDRSLSTEGKIIFWDNIPVFTQQAILKNDKESIEIALYQTYGAYPEIIKNVEPLANAINSTIEKLIIKLPKKANEIEQSNKLIQLLLEENIKSELTIQKFTKTPISVAAAFRDPDLVKNIIAADKKFAVGKWKKIKTQEQIVEDGLTQEQIVADSIRYLFQMKGHSFTSPSRSQAYKGNVRQWTKEIFGAIRDADLNKEGKPRLNYTLYKNGSINPNSITYDGKKIDVDLSFSENTSEAALRDIESVELTSIREKNEKEAQNFLNDYAKFYSDLFKQGKITNVELAMVQGALLSHMSSVAARAASVKYVAENIQQGTKLRYEHMQPRVGIVIKIFDAHINGNGVENVNKFFENYNIAIIPETMDDVIKDSKLESSLYEGQTMDMPPWIRYYNDKTLLNSKNRLVNLVNVKTNKVLKVSDAYVKAQEILSDAVDSKIKFSKSVGNARTVSEPKGMSAWDFDDTVARTKSGVIARIPNTSGNPKPGRKVIFLAGGAGSGKSNVVKQLGLKDQGFNIVNQDISLEWLKKNSGLPANMKDLTPEQLSKLGKLQWEARKIAARKQMKFKGRGDGIIVDGTGASMNVMNKQVQEFKDAGYEVQMLFVETSLETAIERNAARKERTLKQSIVRKNHEKVQGNKEGFRKLFGNNFAEVKTDNLKIGDPMPQGLVNKINSFTTDFEVRRLTAEEFAIEGADILEQGGEFDFREFDVVTEGEKGPLFGKAMDRAKKYGLKDNYILTARPHAAKKPIYEFLKSQGLNIPLDNIVTLENSTPEAKALWLAEKVGDGYNDIYFADDALQNVQAVKNMLDQFDVKSKVQQAKVKFSKSAGKEFNDILEQTKGLPSDYIISQAKARQRGKRKGLFQFFVPPSADDFAGLLQMFQGKGKQGMEHAAWFKKNLLDPFARGDRSLNGARQRTAEEFKALRKKFPEVSKKLRKVIPTGDYTFGDAIRVYLWDKNDIEVPGLTKTDKNNMLKLVQADPELQAFADVLGVISRKEDGYIAPDEYWMTKDIVADITEDGIIGDGRKDHLAEWIENKDLIFTPENLNKIEFLYGSNFREALEDSLYRMENGTSRPAGSNRIVNNFLNWMNGGISVVMNWNTRSAVLQTLSTVNFINWGDNNILAAAKAFANQKQYWKDFAFLFNSDMLKQRRSGLKTSIESRELMSEVEGAVNPVRAAIRYLLRIGFTPTKFADSFAIASGGASFYRNRINTYKKQGYNQTEAEAKAFLDFQETAEEAQQSSRPDRLSQQQTSVLGRFILAFQNTPMQYVRISKKETLDLVNGRFTGFTGPNSFSSKVGKILYYTAIQNLIFYSLQTALFAAMFSDEEDDEEFFDKKTERILDNLADGVLRGMGVGGAVISTLKNIILKYIANKDSKMYDESAILMEGLKLSPPLSIKARQLLSADKTMRYNRDVIKQMETFDIDNPMWNAAFNVVEMTTNAPLSRMESKYKNVRNALDNRYETWQRVAFMLGYNTWSLGVKNEEIEAIKKEIKAIKTYERKKKAQEEKQAKQAEKQALINKDIEKEKKLQEEGKLKDPKCRHVNTKGERCSVSVANAGDLCTIHEEVPQRTDGKKTRCKQVKADGKRCGMQTSNKSGYCYYHD